MYFQVKKLHEDMILFLASLDQASYQILLKVFEDFEKGKLSKKKKGKHQAFTSKPNCAGSQFKGEFLHKHVLTSHTAYTKLLLIVAR